jgi:hypothetical protein
VKPWLPSLNSNKLKVGGIHVARPRTKNKPGSAAGVIYIYTSIWEDGSGLKPWLPSLNSNKQKVGWIQVKYIYVVVHI